MTWVEFLREFGFPGLIVVALFWLVVLPLKDRFIRHLDAIEVFFRLAPKMLDKIEKDAESGAVSLRAIVDGQNEAAAKLTKLTAMHDERLALVSNVVTNEVLSHMLDAAIEALKIGVETEKIDRTRAQAVDRALQDAKQRLA